MNNSPGTPKRLHPAVAGLIVIVIVGIIGAAATALSNRPKNQTPTVSTANPSTNNDPTMPGRPSSPARTSGNYKDGAYSASVNYFTPDGQEPLTVKVTLAGNTITDSSVSTTPISREGQQYFDRFDSYYKSQVIGQKVSDVSLNRVAGASLTTDAFNQALQKIMQNAAN